MLCQQRSGPARAGPRNAGTRQPTLASLTDTFAGIIDGSQLGRPGHFVTRAFWGGGARCLKENGGRAGSPLPSVKTGGARGQGGGRQKVQSTGERLSPASPPETRQPGRGPDRELWIGPWTRPAGGEGYTQRSEVDPQDHAGSAGQTGALQGLPARAKLGIRGGASCPP